MNKPEQMHVVKQIVADAEAYIESHPQYVGLLLCEGTFTSPDVKLYRKVYPYLHVVPAGGWSDIRRIIGSVRKRMNGFPVFGLIDRDAKSKNEVGKLREKGIYCTKLPFIENIISAPEIVKIIGKYNGIDVDKELENVKEKLLYLLSANLRDSLPVNIFQPEEEAIASINISIKLENGQVIEKNVSKANIIYAYRDKAVANETADIFGIIGRRSYYKFFINCLENPRLCEQIVKRARTYLPEINVKLEDDEF